MVKVVKVPVQARKPQQPYAAGVRIVLRFALATLARECNLVERGLMLLCGRTRLVLVAAVVWVVQICFGGVVIRVLVSHLAQHAAAKESSSSAVA